jgi:ubiquinone/menaquinone biosynthesis C-methylase UbiE
MNKCEILKNIEDAGEMVRPCIEKLFRDPDYFKLEGTNDYLETVQKIQELDVNGTVLDIGTGCGVLPIVLAKMSLKVWAVDKLNRLEQCGREMLYSECGVQFALVDVQKDKLPFPDSFFDCITCMNVIPHFQGSPKRFLSEVRRVLKKNGYFIFTSPNWARIENRISSIFRVNFPVNFQRFWDKDNLEGHIREYTLAEMKQMLIWSGFEPIQIYTKNVANLKYYHPFYKKLFRRTIRLLQFFFNNKERIFSISIKNQNVL